MDFGSFYEVSLGASFAISGWSYFLSITFDAKAAQLYIVVALLVFFMTAGVTPKLTALIGKPTYGLSYLSYARWLCEDLFVGHTYELTAVYRLPPKVSGMEGIHVVSSIVYNPSEFTPHAPSPPSPPSTTTPTTTTIHSSTRILAATRCSLTSW